MPLHSDKVLESCRLCQLHPGTINFTDTPKFMDQVFECTKVEMNNKYMNLLPKCVCLLCKHSIEEFFSFVQDIQLVDKRLQAHAMKYESLDADLTGQAMKYENPDADLMDHNENSTSSTQTSPLSISTNALACSHAKSYAVYKNLQILKYKKHNYPGIVDPYKVAFIQLDAEKESGITSLVSKAGSSSPERVVPQIREISLSSSDIALNKEPLQTYSETQNNEDIKNEDESNTPHEDETHKSQTDKLKVKEDISEDNPDISDNVTRDFSCTYDNCTVVCKSAYSLRNHLMKHEGKMPFLCVTCGKCFTTKNSLTCHEKTHADVKGYVCHECNIGFSVASNLRAHQKKHHEGVRYYCSQCTKAFVTKCSLDRHELVHTGVKEFKCNSCCAAFYTSKELAKHQRYHQGLRMYKCDRCFKTFFEKHHLTIHIRSHTGERPYVCKIAGCSKSFTESQKLTRHMKTKHRFK